MYSVNVNDIFKHFFHIYSSSGSESSNSAFCSSGIAARYCLNKAFCIIIVDLINCQCLYC